MRFLRRLFTILILLLLAYVLYRFINPSGADTLVDKVQNFFSFSRLKNDTETGSTLADNNLLILSGTTTNIVTENPLEENTFQTGSTDTQTGFVDLQISDVQLMGLSFLTGVGYKNISVTATIINKGNISSAMDRIPLSCALFYNQINLEEKSTSLPTRSLTSNETIPQTVTFDGITGTNNTGTYSVICEVNSSSDKIVAAVPEANDGNNTYRMDVSFNDRRKLQDTVVRTGNSTDETTLVSTNTGEIQAMKDEIAQYKKDIESYRNEIKQLSDDAKRYADQAQQYANQTVRAKNISPQQISQTKPTPVKTISTDTPTRVPTTTTVQTNTDLEDTKRLLQALVD